MAEFSPAVNLTVEDTLNGNGNEQNIALEFKSLKDFEPEQVAKIFLNFVYYSLCAIYYVT